MISSQQLDALNDSQRPSALRLERNLLKDQVSELLRDYIISGRIAPGTKLVEREVAQLLGVSRAPVRDALIELEREGLVVSKSNGRYVIELTQRDICELYQVRLVLEKLAVELAARNISPEGAAALAGKQQEMEAALASRNAQTYRRCDVETHRLVWQLAGNEHLLQTLDSMMGPIFMFVSWHTEKFDWNVTLELHADLVQCIVRSDPASAAASIERHLNNALSRSLRILQAAEPAKS